jgi:Fe2+ transport system protein B
MKDLQQKFRVNIEVDLSQEEFDVNVINMSARKGFIDIERLKNKLREIFQFMQREGMDELTSQIEREQLQ